MTPDLRVKFVLFTSALVLATTLAWNAAQGQMRPPRPGPNPGRNPPGGIGGMNRPGKGFDGGLGFGWRCPKCGQTGQGMVPPETCPGCGVRFINGMGNGSAGGLIGDPPGVPMNPIPPGAKSGAPPNNGANFGPIVESSDGQPQSSPRRRALIALTIGIILVGVVVLACGAFLVVHSMRSEDASSDRRRGRRDDDDDD